MRKSDPAICFKLDLASDTRRKKRSEQISQGHLNHKLRSVAMEGSVEHRDGSLNRNKEMTPSYKSYARLVSTNNSNQKEKFMGLYRNLRNGKSPSIQTQRYANSTFRIKNEGRSHRSIRVFETIEGKCQVFVLDNGIKTRHVIRATTVEQFNRKILQNCNSEVVCFKTVPTNLVYDYYLSHPQCDIRFLNDKTITIRPYERSTSKRIDLRSFDVVRCIGAGGFSKVYLARFKQDGRFYALKLIDKHFIIENRKKGIIQNERRIMALMSHPFTLDLKYAFQTADMLVFVMDYCAGGSLFTYVKHFRTMSEEMARFFLLEILFGIEHLHDKDIVYRDIKPQNILVTIDGHIKIADFGLAKPDITRESQAFSFCGSPEYMAPEMIMKVGHSHPVDHYCIGALLYELVTGLPPFYSTNTDKIYQAVLGEELSFPDDIILSTDCKNLIYALLNKNHKLRLGSLNGVRQILAHPWFGKFKRQEVLNKLLKPPIKIDDIKTVTYNLMASEQYPEMDKLIQKQQRSDMQFFRKVMKNFYYDCTHTTSETNIEKQNTPNKSPALKTLKTDFSYLKIDEYGSSKKLNYIDKRSPQASRKIKKQSRNFLNDSSNLNTLRKGQYA